MPSWTHLIRFIANEDNQIHLGQLLDTARDVGLDTYEGKEVKAYLINGSIFDGVITDTVLTVKSVSRLRAKIFEVYMLTAVVVVSSR